MPLQAQPGDITTVATLADWLEMTNLSTESTDTLQEIISGFSQFLLTECGRDLGYFTGDGSGNAPQTFTEVRDGTGSNKMAVKNGPIGSVILLQIDGTNIPQSTAWNMFGFFVEQGGNFLVLRRGTTPIFPVSTILAGPFDTFRADAGNVTLTYTGRYKVPPNDILLMALKSMGVYASKRLREDEGGRTTPQTGAVTQFRPWDLSPEAKRVINSYRRTSMIWP